MINLIAELTQQCAIALSNSLHVGAKISLKIYASKYILFSAIIKAASFIGMAYPCFTVSTMHQPFHISNMVSIMLQTNVLTGAHNLLSSKLAQGSCLPHLKLTFVIHRGASAAGT